MEETFETADRTAALLRVAEYLSRPQRFMAVGDARAEMRRTVDLAAEGSVVLTTHGEPEAAVVPFTTLEDMRRALIHLLVAEMESGFARLQERTQSRLSGSESRLPKPLVDEEMEKLAGEVLHKARRRKNKSTRKVTTG